MNVIFQTKSKNQNRFTMNVEGYGRVYFNKGAYITSDKELIEKLINHPLKKRGEYKVVTNDEVVAKYLDGEEPDILTNEILENVTMEGIVELGKEVKSSETHPTLIKIEIEGEPITDQVQQILDFYSKNKSKHQVSEELKEEEIETIETTKSGDMKATEAVEFIEKSGRDVLENFLSEDEERKTVLEAYNSKMGD